MKIYRFCLRVVSVVVGLALLYFGGAIAIMGVLWSLGLTAPDDKYQPRSFGEFIEVVIWVAIGLAWVVLGWIFVRGPSHEIRLRYDPTHDELRLSVESTVRTRLIRLKEKAAARFWPLAGNRSELRIRLTRGSIPVSTSPEIQRFIADVWAMHPSVPVAGQWPMDKPFDVGQAGENIEPA